MSEYTELVRHLEVVHSWRQPREFFNLNQLRKIHACFVFCPSALPVKQQWCAVCEQWAEHGADHHVRVGD